MSTSYSDGTFSDDEYSYSSETNSTTEEKRQINDSLTPPWLQKLGSTVTLDQILVNIAKPGWTGYTYFHHEQRTVDQSLTTQDIARHWHQLSPPEQQGYKNRSVSREPIWVLPDYGQPKSDWTGQDYFYAQQRCEQGDSFRITRTRQNWQKLSDQNWLTYVDLAEANRRKYPPRRKHQPIGQSAFRIFLTRFQQLDSTINDKLKKEEAIVQTWHWLVADFCNHYSQIPTNQQLKEFSRYWLTLVAQNQIQQIRQAITIVNRTPKEI